MSLSAEAEKRKERLLALKKRKRGVTDDEQPETPTIVSDDGTVAETTTEVAKPCVP